MERDKRENGKKFRIIYGWVAKLASKVMESMEENIEYVYCIVCIYTYRTGKCG